MPPFSRRYAAGALLLLGIALLAVALFSRSGTEGIRPVEAVAKNIEAVTPPIRKEKSEDGWVKGQPVRYGRAVGVFTVRARKGELELFPCNDCHADEPANPKERKLEDEHEDLVLDHGRERFWCLTCHGQKDKDALVSLKGRKIDFDESYLLCGQCHFQRQKDWYFGGHGKRVSGWQSARQITICVECHDPHSPSIKPFQPVPPPLVRKGLEQKSFQSKAHVRVWESAQIVEEGR